jgi:hypothetical protein
LYWTGAVPGRLGERDAEDPALPRIESVSPRPMKGRRSVGHGQTLCKMIASLYAWQITERDPSRISEHLEEKRCQTARTPTPKPPPDEIISSALRGNVARVPPVFIAMTDNDLIIEKIAREIFDRDGAGCVMIARERADIERRLGDPESAATWHRIAASIERISHEELVQSEAKTLAKQRGLDWRQLSVSQRSELRRTVRQDMHHKR